MKLFLIIGLISMLACNSDAKSKTLTDTSEAREIKVDNPETDAMANSTVESIETPINEEEKTVKEIPSNVMEKEESNNSDSTDDNSQNDANTTESNIPDSPAASEEMTEESNEDPIVHDEVTKDVREKEVEDVVVEEVIKVEQEDEDIKQTEIEETPTIKIPDHGLFDALLRKYVTSSGKVNYKGLKSAESELDAYLGQLDQHVIEPNWSRAEKLAYWINAYNAFTLKLILDHYPTSSITNIYGGKPWDKKWISLGGKSYSLNQIENDIIRPRFNEPRIHFAVNCAAVSCPPLLNRAFTAGNLESLLEKQTRKFINDTGFTKVSAQGIQVSKIFEWYAVDFGDLKNFLSKYYAGDLPSAPITYYEYDWSLNSQ